MKKWILLSSVLFVYALIFVSCGGSDDEYDDEEMYNTGNEYGESYNSGGQYNSESNEIYNYDVSGYDEYDNQVTGNVDIDNEDGSGYIEDENGNQKYINVKWTGYGEMEGYDQDGNYYVLEVD